MNSLDAPVFTDRAADLFGSMALPPFPVERLPSAVADYATDQGQLIGADPAMLAMFGIVICAACTHDGIKVQPKRHDPTWLESARLWVAGVGDPSAKKSPALGKMAAPAYKVDREWREASAKLVAEWKQQCKNTPKEETEPPRPIEKHLIVSDATPEKIGDILSKSEPRGIAVINDELSGWIASQDAYKQGQGKDRAFWLESFNGGPKSVDRVVRGSLFIENLSCCVMGGIQPDVIQRYADTFSHDGLLQRFLLIYAQPASMGVDRHPDMQAKDRYSETVRRLTELQPTDTPVRLSEGAHAVREEVATLGHRIATAHPNKHLSAAVGKWDGLFARLALTFHCIECVNQSRHPVDVLISEATAQAVAETMRALLHHAIRFYSGMDTAQDLARDIAALILAHRWERFTVKRDLDRYMKASRRLKPWEIEEALDRLEAFGWLLPDLDSRFNDRGRPVAYFVNPDAHERFKGHAETERARRAEVSALMKELRA